MNIKMLKSFNLIVILQNPIFGKDMRPHTLYAR